MRRVFLSVLVILITSLITLTNAQVLEPVKWSTTTRQIDNTTFEIIFKASIDKGWHLYGLNIPANGPVATSFTFEQNNSYELIGKPISSIKPKVLFDNTFEMELELFDGSVTFRQKVQLKEKTAAVKGSIEFMSCDDSRCLPPVTKDFEFELQSTSKIVSENATKEISKELPAKVLPVDSTKVPVNGTSEVAKKQTQSIVTEDNSVVTEKSGTKESLWKIFLKALATGILAVFTPCVFPIIPLTVAFFMRDNTLGRRIFQALFFGLTIVAIYTSVGLLAGLAGINIVELTKHWLANLIIFAVLLALAASFFGMYEIMLPGSLSSKLDKKVDDGGVLAPFFLALVTAVVSFSCVGPIAGYALGAALTGEVLMPTVAMLGFSISFAFPFVIIGIFPALLRKLPKSGGWLNSVKVFFAFIILATALVFLGNTQWKIFSRDVILSLEIIIFVLMGFYLLGKIKFAHDSELPYIKVPRLILAILSFATAVYLVPGLFGNPLKAISAFLPAQETSEFSMFAPISATGSAVEITNPALCDSAPKHAGFLHMPHNLTGYFDYEEGIACAKEQNKPVLLDFVGHTCKNCKKMYAEVWSDKRVQEKLRNDFIIIALYTDDRTKLPETEWITSSIDNKLKKTIGAKNLDFEISKYGTNALPLYVIIDGDENILTKEKYYTYSSDIDMFLAFLNEGTSNFEQKK